MRTLFCRVSTAEKRFGTTRTPIRSMIERGELRSIRLLGSIRLLQADVSRLLGESTIDFDWPTGPARLDDLAEFFLVQRATVRRAIATGALPGYRVGKCYRANWEHIRESVEAQLAPSPNCETRSFSGPSRTRKVEAQPAPSPNCEVPHA